MANTHQHRYAFHRIAPGPAIVELCSCGRQRKTQATRCPSPDAQHEGGAFSYERHSCRRAGCMQGYIATKRAPACCCGGLVPKGAACRNCRDALESHGGAIVHQCMVLNADSIEHAAALAQAPRTKTTAAASWPVGE